MTTGVAVRKKLFLPSFLLVYLLAVAFHLAGAPPPTMASDAGDRADSPSIPPRLPGAPEHAILRGHPPGSGGQPSRPNAKIIISYLKERPVIRRIEYKGIKSVTESEILD